MEFTTDFLASVAGFEGSTDYMYQDTSGHVTIGVGHLIASPELAAALPFTGKSTSFQDWCRVKRALRGKPAAYYKRCSSSRLAPRAVANLLQADLDATVAQLTAGLPCFATLPGEAQKALCDMGFNLGVHRLLETYPSLLRCVEAADWPGAASACHRNGISPERNAWCARMFQNAAAG